MRINPRIVACSLLFALTAGVGLGEPETNKPTAGSTATTNGSPSIPAVKSPLVLKGLYGNRLKSTNELDSSQTESAVIRGLRWLQTAQNKDGSWGVGADEFDAATGLALLAFLGHMETPASQEFGATVQKGMMFLLADKKATDKFARASRSPAFGHAISTWALCEGSSLTKIPVLKSPAEEGLVAILRRQRKSGLWDAFYRTDDGNDDIDISVLQVFALKSGRMMGSEADGLKESLRKASEAMERTLENKPDAAMIAGAVQCLQLCGEARSPTCRTGLVALATMTPEWESPSFKDPIFRWYLANQAFCYQGGQQWARWNRLFFPMLLKHQVVSQDSQGHEVGYWDSPGAGERFGRVYATALSIRLLDVFYIRHLPTYERVDESAPLRVDDEDIVIKFD